MQTINKLKQKTYKLLRWSEKYTKTDMLYLAKGGFWLTLGQFFASASAFLLAIAYANFLSPEVYGTYKYILSIAGILGAFTLTGMGTAVVRSVAKGFDGTLQFAFLKSLKWSIFMVLASFVGAIYYFINDNYTLAISLLIVGSFSPIIQSSNLYTSFLNGKKEFKTTTIYGVFRSLIPALSIFITIFLTNNPVIIVLVYFLTNTITATFFYLKAINKFKENDKTDESSLNYGKHLSLISILGSMATHLDKILIFNYLGAIQLAIYTFALAIPKEIYGSIRKISTLAFPKIANTNIDKLKQTLPYKILLILLTTLIIAFLYFLTAPYIYKLLFPQYIESIIYSQALILIILFTSTILAHDTITANFDKNKLYTLSIFTPLAKIILLIILTPQYGIWGAVVALLLANLFNSILVFYLFKKM